MSEMRIEGFEGVTGLQQPVGTELGVEDVARTIFTLPYARQLDFLRVVSPFVVVRSDTWDRASFIAELRLAPSGEAKLAPLDTGGLAPADFDRMLELFLQQSVGGQEHILRMAAPRIVAELDPHAREHFIRTLEEALVQATEGEGLAPPP